MMATKATGTATLTYRGQVRDRMDGKRVLYQSRPCRTWEEAQHRAERADRRIGYGERSEIVVV